MIKITVETSSNIKVFEDEDINFAVEQLLDSKDFLSEYIISFKTLYLSTYDEGGSKSVKIETDYEKTILQIDKLFRERQDFYWKFH